MDKTELLAIEILTEAIKWIKSEEGNSPKNPFREKDFNCDALQEAIEACKAVTSL